MVVGKVCPRCRNRRVYAIRRNKLRCANASCRKEWKTTELPLQLSRWQWINILKLFLGKKHISAICIAKKTQIERKRVLRVLSKTRIAMKKDWGSAFLGDKKVLDIKGNPIKCENDFYSYLSLGRWEMKRGTGLKRYPDNYAAEDSWRYNHHQWPLNCKIEKVLTLLSKLHYVNSKKAVTNLHKQSGISTVPNKEHQRLVEMKLTQANSHLEQGQREFNLKQYEKALLSFNKSIGQDKEKQSAYYFRGYTYLNMKTVDKAVADFNKAIELNPKDARSYIGRGIAFYMRNEFTEAIIDFSRVIALDSKYQPEAYYFRGKCYYKIKEFDRAITDFNKVIQLDEKNANAYYMCGIAHCAKKEYDKAIASFSEAIKLNPNYQAAYRERGKIQARKGNFIEARRDLKKALELDPKDTSTSNKLNEVEAEIKQYSWRYRKEGLSDIFPSD